LPLLVVPLAPEETPFLTLEEWDGLRRATKVVFERPDHPLVQRLRAEGVDAGPFDDEPAADADGWALVTDPGSGRTWELAAAGARVTSGAARPPDAATAARGAYIARRAQSALGTLALVMARLRRDEGCPWDAEQTHESLQVHLIEEAHEVLEAIDGGNITTDLQEELGDLLLQVLFHSEIAAGDGRFDIAGVATTIVEKLVRRHPHVFGEVAVADANEVVRNWETIKQQEKARASAFDGIPRDLPALLAAQKTQKRAAALGFEADAESAAARAAAAVSADADASALGDALFWLVALARSRGIDAEGALRKRTLEFRRSL